MDYTGSDQNNTGVIGSNGGAGVAIAGISDGTSNTIAVGEKNLCTPKLGVGSDPATIPATPGAGTPAMRATMTTRWAMPLSAPAGFERLVGMRPGNPWVRVPHTAKFNAVFCDGHVAGIGYSVTTSQFSRISATSATVRSCRPIFNPRLRPITLNPSPAPTTRRGRCAFPLLHLSGATGRVTGARTFTMKRTRWLCLLAGIVILAGGHSSGGGICPRSHPQESRPPLVR